MAYIKLEDLQKFPIRQNHYDKENGNEHFICGIETVIEYAENLPTADIAEVKHGHWMTYYCTNGGQSIRGRTIRYRTYTCDACGKANGRHKTNYCLHRGAKMDGGEE